MERLTRQLKKPGEGRFLREGDSSAQKIADGLGPRAARVLLEMKREKIEIIDERFAERGFQNVGNGSG